MESLIKPDDIVYVWAGIIGIVFIANWMDQKWKWANKLSIVVLCIVGGMALANFKVLPFESPVYKGISGIMLKLAIPMLLFKSDVKKIYRESGKVFIAFHVATVASLIAAIVYSGVLKNFNVPELQGLVAMQVGGSIGGTVNMVAMAETFNVSPNLMSGSTLIGNFNLGILLFVLALVAQSKFFRKKFNHPYIKERESILLEDPELAEKPLSAAFWKDKKISLIDVLKTFFTAFFILALSQYCAGIVSATNAPKIIKQLFGNVYLLMTTFTTLGATFISQWFSKLKFGDEFGMIMLTMWYATIGTTANLVKIAQFGTIAMFIFFVNLITHLIVAFSLGKILKLSLEEICCGITATIGGPSASSALTINQGWRHLIAPSILCSLYGYIIGNYLGVFMGNLLF